MSNNVNRIAGSSSSSVTYSRNYAYDNMILIANGTVVTRPNNNINGTGKELTTLKTFTFYNTESNWNTNAWNIASEPDSAKVWRICDQETFPFLQWQQDIDCIVEIKKYDHENGILLFPNPATSHVKLKIEDESLKVKNVQLYDIFGKLLKNIPVTPSDILIDLSPFSSGVYFVYINTGNKVIAKKLIKY
jgi:hypothetical protein